MFWLKMAFRRNYGEKKLEFSHQKSALPMIFFKILQKAHISRIFQTRAFRKTERAEPSRAELFDQKLEPKPSQTEPSLGSGATLIITDKYWFKCKRYN